MHGLFASFISLLLVSSMVAVFADPGSDDGVAGAGGAVPVEGDSALGAHDSSVMFSDLKHEARRDPGDKRDIVLRGDYAYTAGHAGLHIYDISTPTNPVQVGFIHCPSRDVTIVGDVAALVLEGGAGSCNGSNGVAIVDISDPTSPSYVKRFAIPAHTITAYGETGVIHVASQYLYPHISGPLSSSGFQDIIYAPSPASAVLKPRFHFPVVAENGQPVNAPSCHEITFQPDLARGYCAALVETHIWDMTDPLKPKVISVINNPGVSIHHGAFAAQGGTVLIINDEEGGALVPACFPRSTGKTPQGALWFYDVSNEAVPLVQSYISLPTPNNLPLRCTSHFGNVLPNDEQLVWGWYAGGPVLVDFSNILLPEIKDSFVVSGADTWGAYYHEGYVFTGDMKRGFEVFSIS